MSWVCSNCSTANEEESTCCTVCGYDRPTDTRARDSEAVEGKIVFSDFAVMKESVKALFQSVSSVGAKIKNAAKERPPRESRKKASAPRSPCEPKVRVKTSKKERAPRIKSGFAKPWPEHNIKFDVDFIKNKGFVRSEQTEMNGIKGYTFYKADGKGQFIRAEMLIVLHMAHRA